ncbi:MAG: VTT domain-containing protein [bacterium]
MGIDLTNFQQVFSWIISHGYALMFLAMCIEGPTVTAAATFAATLGFFNPVVVLILSLLGDIIPDSVYYGLGRWKGLGFVSRFGHKFGLTKSRMEHLRKGIHLHGGKTVAILKYTPVLSTPGLMLVGALKMKWWKYFCFVLLVTFQKTLTFMVLGYFFGRVYDIGKYIKYGALVPFFIIVAYFSFAFIYKKISKRLADKI